VGLKRWCGVVLIGQERKEKVIFGEGARVAEKEKSLDHHDMIQAMMMLLSFTKSNNVPKGRHLPHDTGYDKKKCHYALGHHKSRAAAC
jgi:hypothetical protein